MANFTQDYLRVGTLIKVLKADMRFRLWDEKTKTMLFDGYVYQLYDTDKFNNLYIEDMSISYDSVGVSILTEGRNYDDFIKIAY